MVPAMARAGQGYRFHMTGLTHDERGYPDMTVSGQAKLVGRLTDKIKKNAAALTDVVEEGVDGAESSSCPTASPRASRCRQSPPAAGRGAEGRLRCACGRSGRSQSTSSAKLATRVKAFVVPELNLGQMVREVERCAGHAGGRRAARRRHGAQTGVIEQAILEAVR
jgi:2-oxoglutarate/2-oxoacid ferredoxin oxidoreductase subunit alpha